MSSEELIKAVVEPIRDDIKEVKDDIKEVRKQLTDLTNKDPISRKECEAYRAKCNKGGYPAWVVALVTVLGVLLTYIFTPIVKG